MRRFLAGGGGSETRAGSYFVGYGTTRMIRRLHSIAKGRERWRASCGGSLAAPLALLGLWSSVCAGELPVVGTGDGIELMRALGAAYTADNPHTSIVVPPSIGSGGGVAAV